MEKNQDKMHEIGFTLFTSSSKKIKELEESKIELSKKIKEQYEIRDTALKMISDSNKVYDDIDIDFIFDLIFNGE